MHRFAIAFFTVICLTSVIATAQSIDLSHATVVIRADDVPAGERIAPTILTEEITRRTQLHWQSTIDWPMDAKAIIAISTVQNPAPWQDKLSSALRKVPQKPEGFSIEILRAGSDHPEIVAVTGFDSRGAMFGVGKLLRNLNWDRDRVSLPAGFNAAEAPDRPLRGHQIGYRDTANSWDAWTFDQYDQYFREMVIFGTNAVENIPWQEEKPCPLMKYLRDEMNVKFAELCAKYDLDHWIWVPVDFNLPDEAAEARALQRQAEFYQRIARLDAIFVPGGDPGNNKAIVLIPHLEKMSAVALTHHPRCKIWLSLQHFKQDDVDLLYDYLATKQPTWFGGLVMGPGSPPMELTRQRLPKPYQLRWYPDITHVVRCQYPVPWLDPALGMTLGRECVNPRPVDYAQIYQMDYAFTDGFLSYSDGVHDDFNKSLWSQLGWNPKVTPREVAVDYARFFFHPEAADGAADGLFALETNMRGDLAENGSISATFQLWHQMEKRMKDPGSPWRFHMHLFRAYYDQYTRLRHRQENELEQQALMALADADQSGIAESINNARVILAKATNHPATTELRTRLIDFAGQLFQEIGLQTSVPTYHASNYERGAVIDFIDYPLNNRWWLEDQFDRISKLTDHAEQLARIDIIRNWENPGQGGYYDVLGHVGKSPRIIKLLLAGDAMRHEDDIPMPTQRWMREKQNINRQAWHSYMDSLPVGITYNDLDSSAEYTIKLFSQRSSPLVIDGVKATLIKTGETYDKVTEQIFAVPREATKDGRITLTWEPLDQRHLNWRDHHYVTDIWVMKSPAK